MTKKQTRKPKSERRTSKQSSARVSSIAGRVMRCVQALSNPDDYTIWGGGERFTLRDIKALAASCLSQDETTGQKTKARAAKGKRRR